MVVSAPPVATLAERAALARAEATRAIATTARLRASNDRRRAADYQLFLTGRVGTRSVVALQRVGALYVSPALLERADLLVRLGEEFETPLQRISAGFTSDLSTLLTLVRAADELFAVHFNHPPSGLRMSFGRPAPVPANP